MKVLHPGLFLHASAQSFTDRKFPNLCSLELSLHSLFGTTNVNGFLLGAGLGWGLGAGLG